MNILESPHAAELATLELADIPAYSANQNRGGMRPGDVAWAIFDQGDFYRIGHSAMALRYTHGGLEDARNQAAALQASRGRDLMIIQYTCPNE